VDVHHEGLAALEVMLERVMRDARGQKPQIGAGEDREAKGSDGKGR